VDILVLWPSDCKNVQKNLEMMASGRENELKKWPAWAQWTMFYLPLDPMKNLAFPSSWSKKELLLKRASGIREALPRRVLGQDYYGPCPSGGRA
jgi:hypothetical protein